VLLLLKRFFGGETDAAEVTNTAKLSDMNVVGETKTQKAKAR
jgi:hypothetical protein